MRTKIRLRFSQSLAVIFQTIRGKKVSYQCAISGESIRIGDPVLLVRKSNPKYVTTATSLSGKPDEIYYLASIIFSKIPVGHYPFGYWTEEGFIDSELKPEDVEVLERFQYFNHGRHTKSETQKFGYEYYIDIYKRD